MQEVRSREEFSSIQRGRAVQEMRESIKEPWIR